MCSVYVLALSFWSRCVLRINMNAHHHMNPHPRYLQFFKSTLYPLRPTVAMADDGTSGREVFRAGASINELDADTKQWTPRGVGGTVVMLESARNREDIRIRWQKGPQTIWWTLSSSKLKAKGERALVFRAFQNEQQDNLILAVRFSDQSKAIDFATKYYGIFPQALLGATPIDQLFDPQCYIYLKVAILSINSLSVTLCRLKISANHCSATRREGRSMSYELNNASAAQVCR